MFIRMLDSFSTPTESYRKGVRYEVDNSVGQKLVQKRTAIEVAAPKADRDDDSTESRTGGARH